MTRDVSSRESRVNHHRPLRGGVAGVAGGGDRRHDSQTDDLVRYKTKPVKTLETFINYVD